MAREPVLAGVHRRDVLADEAADRSVEPDALAQAAGRSRRRRIAGRDDRSGQTGARHQERKPEAGDRRYAGDGKGDCAPHRFAPARALPRTSGEGGRPARAEAAAELQPRGAAPGESNRRYAHAKQYKRMKKALRSLRSRVGRVMRDVERQLDGVAQQSRAALEDLIGRTRRILSQKQKDKNKLYAPEVECLA